MSIIEDRITPLLWRACLAGDVGQMEKAMAKGADQHGKDRNGDNCLHMTAKSGEVDALERMLEEGLHLDSTNQNGQSALHIATNKDHLGIIRCLMRRGADVDVKTRYSGMTALHLACRDNNEDVVQCLLDGGANCAIQDKINNYADFYTNDKKVLDVFDAHFPVCTHGRKPGEEGGGGNHQQIDYSKGILDAEEDMSALYRTGPGGQPVIDDSQEVEKAKAGQKGQKKQHWKVIRKELDRRKQTYRDRDHQGPGIYDKMEHYNVERDGQVGELAKHEAKKIKLNHGIEYSDEHKKRMQQNVFDRLMGGGKKKAPPKK